MPTDFKSSVITSTMGDTLTQRSIRSKIADCIGVMADIEAYTGMLDSAVLDRNNAPQSAIESVPVPVMPIEAGIERLETKLRTVREILHGLTERI